MLEILLSEVSGDTKKESATHCRSLLLVAEGSGRKKRKAKQRGSNFKARNIPPKQKKKT